MSWLSDPVDRRKAGEKPSTRSEIDRAASAFHKVVRIFLLDRSEAYKRAKRSWKASEIIQFSSKASVEIHEQTEQSREFEKAFRTIAKTVLGEH